MKMANDKKRVYYFDFVRVIAMALIIIFHFNISVSSKSISSFEILKNNIANANLAYIGVPLFFILSGATLMLSNSKAFSTKEFYIKRFKSIYPLFWISYLLTMLYYFLKYKTVHPFVESPEKWTFILTLLGLDGYTAYAIPNYYILGEWFLGCLVLMYILFPILYKGIKEHPIVLGFIILIIYISMINNYVWNFPMTRNVFIRLPEFTFGMYFVKYIKRINVPVFIVSCICMSILIFIPLKAINTVFLFLIMGIFSFNILVFTGQKIKTNITINMFFFLSKYSFAIYLMHHVVSEQIISLFKGISLSNIEVILLFLIVIFFDILVGYLIVKLYDFIRKQIKELLLKDA